LPDDHKDKASNSIKSIVRLRYMDMTRKPHCHYPYLVHGTHQKDTNGRSFEGHANPARPTDIAVLHHYCYKSYKEYIAKRTRGRADLDQVRADVQVPLQIIEALEGEVPNGTLFDDAAWKVMKKYVPKYAAFDGF
jgi:hypothetical protein